MRSKLLAILLSVVITLTALTACSTPRLPDPSVSYPEAPAELMKPPEGLKTINENN